MKTNQKQRDAVLGLLNFVEQVTGIRQAITKNYANAGWKLKLEDIDTSLPGIRALHAAPQEDGLVFSIARLNVPSCPELPEALRPLVIGHWQDLAWEPHWRSPMDELSAEPDADASEDGAEAHDSEKAIAAEQPALAALRDEWLRLRGAWLKSRALLIKNNELFDRFQTLRDKVAESNLKSEAVIGNYVFTSDPRLTLNQEAARYPLIVKPLTLSLTSTRDDLPLIEVRLNDEEPTRLMPEVVQTFANESVDFTALKPIEALITAMGPAPIGSEQLTEAVRKQSVHFSTACRWHERGEPLEGVESGIKFRIEEEPVILLQDRPTGLKEAIESIRNRIVETEDIPRHLLEIVCPGVNAEVHPESDRRPTLDEALAATAGEDHEILLTKPANSDQLAIAREIMRNNVVLVQGPPGTGKTHTIANLLGHFLAQGKRVLVTSHTQKALTVLKEKLPEEIQPLSVSMIGDRKDLEKTALELKDRLSSSSAVKLNAKIEELSAARKRLIERQKTVRTRIFELRLKDTQGPVYKGRQYALTELAQKLRSEEAALRHVVPGEVKEGPLPLTQEELAALYKTNGIWDAETQRELMFDLPSLDAVPTPEKMAQMHEELQRLLALRDSDTDAVEGEDSHSNARGEAYCDFVLKDGIKISLKAASKPLFLKMPDVDIPKKTQTDAFIRSIVRECIDDEDYGQYHLRLADELEAVDEAYRNLDKSRLAGNLSVTIASDDHEGVLKAVQWFLEHAPDGRPSFWKRHIDADCKAAVAAIAGVKVNGEAPADEAAFAAVREEAAYKLKEKAAADNWNKFAERFGTPDWASFGPKAAVKLTATYADQIRKAVAWHKESWLPFMRALDEADFETQGLPKRPAPGVNLADDTLNYAEALLLKAVVPLHDYLEIEHELSHVEAWRRNVTEVLAPFAQFSPTIKALEESVLTNPEAWARAHARLAQLLAAKPAFENRSTLLAKLRSTAPDWAQALADGAEGFAGHQAPADIDAAWDWKQLDLIYRSRLSESPESLQKESTALSAELRRNTAVLAAAKAWLACKKRLEGTEALSSLTKLATYMKRSQGNGKRTAIYRQEANRMLPLCQDAVPVWIMMIGDALRNFNSNARFDIVIVDEASQADLTALPILYMGEKIIVVGDDKQVTPLAIGTNDAAVDSFNARYLEGRVKEPKLYDAKVSLYSIIQNMAFPAHMLREHFRCVPDIIGYCNQLSYDGAIRPLRDSSTSNLKPALMTYQVKDAVNVNGLNEAECSAVINLLKAMIGDPAYQGKTFGVICMRSGKPAQINRLKAMMMTAFDPRVIEERQLICGSSAEFQGDERDVILLSMVDAAEPGVMLTKSGDGAEESNKKRYNVAVSRARDQIWVVHSFDPASQLKHDDIRRGLFSWIRQCNAGEADVVAIRREADSEFEVRVAKALIERGYNVEQQHAVSPYRLDMVVRCGGKAVALECDGERFHGGNPIHGDEQIRSDMERQTVLERNGWRFIRLRGAEYFRNPQLAIDRVCGDLHERGIDPEAVREAVEDDAVTKRILNAVERLEAGLEPECAPKCAPECDVPALEEPETIGPNHAEPQASGEALHEDAPAQSTEASTEAPEDEQRDGEATQETVSAPFSNAPFEAMLGMISMLEKEIAANKPEALDVVFASHEDGGKPCGIISGNGEPVVRLEQEGSELRIAVKAVKGLRARGIPAAEYTQDREFKIWRLSAQEAHSLSERFAAYILRTIEALDRNGD